MKSKKDQDTTSKAQEITDKKEKSKEIINA
jgi:hypothetical protein